LLPQSHPWLSDRKELSEDYGGVLSNRKYICISFTIAFDSIVCRELLGCDISKPEGAANAKENGLFASVCPKMVGDAAEILEEMMNK